MACHGPSGGGNPGPAYPHVGGQFQDYSARRLQEYRTGTTMEKDPALFHIMAQVSNRLTDEEIQALATFLLRGVYCGAIAAGEIRILTGSDLDAIVRLATRTTV